MYAMNVLTYFTVDFHTLTICHLGRTESGNSTRATPSCPIKTLLQSRHLVRAVQVQLGAYRFGSKALSYLALELSSIQIWSSTLSDCKAQPCLTLELSSIQELESWLGLLGSRLRMQTPHFVWGNSRRTQVRRIFESILDLVISTRIQVTNEG